MPDDAPLIGVAALDPARRAQLCNPVWLADRVASAGLVVPAESWWVEPGAWAALLAPESSVPAGVGPRAEEDAPAAAMGVRGLVRAAGRAAPPPGWAGLGEAAGADRLLYDLLARDVDAVADLRGQFALAWWDGARARLTLARDHFGQRQLFVASDEGLLWFCSEPAPLAALRGGVSLDRESAFWHLAFGMPPPGKTMAEGVRQVPAAHVLVLRAGELARPVRYWSPLVADSPRHATPEVVEAVRAALDHSLAQSVTPDSGVLLSGGVDSTYLAAGAVAVTGVRPPGYTVEFEAEAGMNETPYAAAVASWLGLTHRVVRVEAPLALHVLDTVVRPAWQPCSAWAAISHHVVLSSARHAGNPQLLSGLGADEVFGGYDHFRGFYARFLRYLSRIGAEVREESFAADVVPGGRDAARVLYPGVARFFDDKALRTGLLPPFDKWEYDSHLRAFYRECLAAKPDAGVMELMVAHECQHRIPDLLFANFEPIARAAGVSVSYPFLDPDVVRLVAGLDVTSRYRTPSGRFSLRLRDLQPNFKHAMLEVARGRIPDEIVDRPRKSFTAPFGAWLYHPAFGSHVLAALDASSFWDLGIVRRDWLETVLKGVLPGPNAWVFQLWALVTLAAWHDTHVAGVTSGASTAGLPVTGT